MGSISGLISPLYYLCDPCACRKSLTPTSELLTTVDADVLGGTIGFSRGATTKDVKAGVIKDVARGGIEETTEYAYEDVLSGASIFSCFIW